MKSTFNTYTQWLKLTSDTFPLRLELNFDTFPSEIGINFWDWNSPLTLSLEIGIYLWHLLKVACITLLQAYPTFILGGWIYINDTYTARLGGQGV